MQTYPSAERNKQPLFDQLRPHIQSAAHVLEVSSGTGQHVAYFASGCPSTIFQPSEFNRDLLPSIQAHIDHFRLSNVRPPLFLDAANQTQWEPLAYHRYDLVLVTNLTHIAPWEVTLGLLRGASTILRTHRYLCIYGPFKRDGEFTTESNETFDRDLRAKNPQWGLRDIDDVAHAALIHQLKLVKVVDMPANNYLLFLVKE
ncbi:hypothetical protein H4R33_005388 [Dimargaris cristalligena]|uniref:SAM-dependent methyltransferase n=1 Tax=Dimargaris cristalligena TaxID=215637 RepID=A0A4P9ZT53_9FUNG|nr:hypothetical protein H4R33_005388 [Dimargaris cristalligena]RKP35912.1 hypothetical protein BJ085DRAFT_28484 [Dimargaris cristalligena]|eukprot:RKP35912.1 hypothetical protein BJ085DRAFT_28484 [Dimargaris cristalligena]